MKITEENEFGYPVRHKRKVPFDPEIVLSHEIMKLNFEIFRMESELDRCILTGQDYQELITEAFSSNIHLSTAMEGNPLSEDEVRRITRRSLREGPPEIDSGFFSQEIFNHIYSYICEDYLDKWTLKTIQNTHMILLNGDIESKPGEFRTGRGIVETDGGQEVFIACPPEHIPEELASLVSWLNTKANAFMPVVSSTIFFHEFESIHPFNDGNGRVGRTLFHVILQNRGLPNSKLCLIEKEIVSDVEKYYVLLARTDFSGDYSELLEDFTKGVWRSYSNSVERFKSKDLLRSDLDEISKNLVLLSKKFKDPFDLVQVRKWMPEESEFKLRSRLTDLVEIGVLRTFGRTKGKRYVFFDPVMDWVIGNSKEVFRKL
jgi:Fic family protein